MTTDNTTISRAALIAIRGALVDAANFISPYSIGEKVLETVDAALAEARAALAMPQVQGEAYCHVMQDRHGKRVGWSGTVWGGLQENEAHLIAIADKEHPDNAPHCWAALYTHPQASEPAPSNRE